MDQPGGKNDVLHTRWSQQSHQPDVVRHREAIAKSSADGNTKASVCGADAKIAASGNREPATGARSGDRGDGGNAGTLQSADQALDPRFIVQRVLGGGKSLELRNVGARGECIFLRARQQESFNRQIVLGLLADLSKLFIHSEGKRIASLRAIEGDATNAIMDLIQDVSAHGAIALFESGILIAPCAAIWSASASENPWSRSTSRVCWPSTGAGLRTEPGVSENLIGSPMAATRPAVGCVVSTIISLANACGS